ncbi:ATP-binding protein [Nocardiopsis algeriensis]|uniref:histidine kinase n=1 Tax=Nocardiopsis algeriensis TaxID=1478215 RepID=A0A841IPV2_9ACTN|nr:signal transduction histidine kinase [Nocardiopsis algeriensis]
MDDRGIGPFSGPAEKGYQPPIRGNAPNPYTSARHVEVDAADHGGTSAGQWHGAGLNEPEPRRAEPAPEPARAPESGDARGTGSPDAVSREEPLPAPPAEASHTVPAFPEAAEAPQTGAAPHFRGETHPSPEQGQWASAAPPAGQDRGVPTAPYPSPEQGQWASAAPPAGQDRGVPTAPYPSPEQGWDPYAASRPGPAPQAPYAPHPGGYGPPAPEHRPPYGPGAHWQGGDPQAPYPGGHPQAPPQAHPYPFSSQQPPAPGYPVHYQPPPVVAYQSPYAAPFSNPGYVLQGQPLFYPYNPYGQPVQHVIVLTSGQPPQVVTADAAGALLTASAQEVREARAVLERGGEETPEEADGPDAEESDTGAGDTEEGGEPPTEQERGEDPAGEAAEASEAAPDTSSATPPDPGPSQSDLLNEALAGLAMRDLSLVDALLEMVEELESDAQDPDLLDKLFQIDNFATRMRRNGENFLVLTGHDGGESDAHDEIVPLLDMARAAMSEIKDYPRVRLGKLPQTSLTGMAADDISHLLAELLDNATANSPEHSQVVISAQELDDGRLMVVVEDEGVGIPEEQIGELNERLCGSVDLGEEIPRHMGLYIAGRIARKHGLETKLESRAFRGVSAYVIVPKSLLRVATPRTPGQSRMAVAPSAPRPTASTAPVTLPAPAPGTRPDGGTSAVTAAGLPRRSATPHGSPLRMMPRPEPAGERRGREDTPPRLTGNARAEQIRDEIDDFLEGERAAAEGREIDDKGEE